MTERSLWRIERILDGVSMWGVPLILQFIPTGILGTVLNVRAGGECYAGEMFMTVGCVLAAAGVVVFLAFGILASFVRSRALRRTNARLNGWDD